MSPAYRMTCYKSVSLLLAFSTVRGNALVLILGEKDKIFPPQEVLSALKTAGIKDVDVEIIPADTHSSLTVRASERILRTALTKVRTDS